MVWGHIELEPEVRDWWVELPPDQRGHVRFYIDLLESEGVLLDEPYTRQLAGKLRELRFHLGRDHIRIAYYIAPKRRIILLTVFRKQRGQERAEVRRAIAAMERCMSEGHTVEDDDA